MISSRLRSVLSAFAMLVIIGGPIFGLFALVVGFIQDSSGPAFGRALLNVAPMVFSSVLPAGALRILVSIHARLQATA